MVVHVGASVVPFEVSTCPAVPFANIAVVHAADWYGIVQPEPPARFVAVVADVAVAEFPVQDPEDPETFPVTSPVRFAVTVVAVISVVARVSVVVSNVNAVSPSSVPSPVQTPIWLFTGVQTFDTSHPQEEGV